MLYCNFYTIANWISQTIFINTYATEGKLSTQQTSTVAYTCQKEGENSQVNKYNDLHVKKTWERPSKSNRLQINYYISRTTNTYITQYIEALQACTNILQSMDYVKFNQPLCH